MGFGTKNVSEPDALEILKNKTSAKKYKDTKGLKGEIEKNKIILTS